MADYTLPDLPYDYGALEPHVSAQIMELHHDKHHAAYVTGANQTLEKLAAARDKDDFGAIVGLEKTLAFHISGHVLHSIFWKNQSPDGGDKPDGALGSAIDENFGSFDKFKAHFTQATSTIQGSGWGVLAYEPLAGRLIVEQVYDHQSSVGHELGAAPRLRRLGARLLPAVQEREGRLLRRPVERRELAGRVGPARGGQGAEDPGLTAGGATARPVGGARWSRAKRLNSRCCSQCRRVGSPSRSAAAMAVATGVARAVAAFAEALEGMVDSVEHGRGSGEFGLVTFLHGRRI